MNTTLHRSPIGLSIYHKVSATMLNLSTIRTVQPLSAAYKHLAELSRIIERTPEASKFQIYL